MMPSVTSGKRKSRSRRSHPVVTGERDLEAAAHHGAVHGRHHGNLERLEAVEQDAVFDLARGTRELADVGAGEERRAFTQQHDGTRLFA